MTAKNIDTPNEFYKYRNFNNNTLESLIEGVIWCARPSSFNDPFDCSFYVEPDLSYEEVKSRNKHATQFNYLELQESFVKAIYTDFGVGGIFSLSLKRNVSLMWSHYADSHKGLCIGYGASPDNDLGRMCHEVNYDKYPKFTLRQLFHAMNNRDSEMYRDIFKKMVLSKDKNWKYEFEWRVIYSENCDMLIKPNFKVISITFGMLMPSWQREIIKGIVAKDMKYFEAVKTKDSYDVQVIELRI